MILPDEYGRAAALQGARQGPVGDADRGALGPAAAAGPVRAAGPHVLDHVFLAEAECLGLLGNLLFQ